MWLIRAGRDGTRLGRFLGDGVAGLGFHDVHQLPNEASREEIRSTFAEKYPNESDGTITSWTGQIYRFLHDVEVGERP